MRILSSLTRRGPWALPLFLGLGLASSGCHEHARPDAAPAMAGLPPGHPPIPPLPPGHPPLPAGPLPALSPEHGKHFQPRLRDGKTGAELDAPRLTERLQAARAIYVGELHNSWASHQSQLFVMKQLYALDPLFAVGIEMLPRTLQPQLEAYLAGTLDEAAFLKAVDWEHTWGFDFALYRPLLEFCRDHGLRMYALNAPRDLAKAVRQRGIEGLRPDERALLPSGHPWPAPAPHEQYVRTVFERHGLSENLSESEKAAAFQRFYSAQLVWDESMAQGVAAILSAPSAPRRVVVLAGSGHVGPYAIPGRAARRGVTPPLTLSPISRASEPSPEGAEAADVVLILQREAD